MLFYPKRKKITSRNGRKRKMKKIAVINDLSGLGKCSLTAAIPVISAMGVQACPLPTAILSNQTGFDSYYWDDYTERMEAYTKQWEKAGFRPDGIYTGFLGSTRQVEIILKFYEKFAGPQTKLIVDPVMGDHGKTYKTYTESLAEQMRRLAEKADVITPNLTEAFILLEGSEGMRSLYEDMQIMERDDYFREVRQAAVRLARKFSLKGLVITGIVTEEEGKREVHNLILEGETFSLVSSPMYGGGYSGTGDLFASVISAGTVKGESLETCAKKAVAFLREGIQQAVEEGTDPNEGICFEPYLYKLWEKKEDLK